VTLCCSVLQYHVRILVVDLFSTFPGEDHASENSSHHCSADPAAGGPIEGITQLGAALISEGHQVEVASLHPPGAPFLAQSGLPVHALGPRRLKYGFCRRFVPWLPSNRHQ
jgi:hypothetical protein